MTQVDFYQLSRDPVELAVAQLASVAAARDIRVLVVSDNAEQRLRISDALWGQSGANFLAHGEAGDGGAARQPLLISDCCEATNGATMLLITDGEWREEALGFASVKLMFGPEARDAAALLWRRFDTDEAVDNRIFKQDPQGRWREGR